MGIFSLSSKPFDAQAFKELEFVVLSLEKINPRIWKAISKKDNREVLKTLIEWYWRFGKREISSTIEDLAKRDYNKIRVGDKIIDLRKDKDERFRRLRRVLSHMKSHVTRLYNYMKKLAGYLGAQNRKGMVHQHFRGLKVDLSSLGKELFELRKEYDELRALFR